VKAIFWGQPNQTNVIRKGDWIVPQKVAVLPAGGVYALTVGHALGEYGYKDGSFGGLSPVLFEGGTITYLYADDTLNETFMFISTDIGSDIITINGIYDLDRSTPGSNLYTSTDVALANLITNANGTTIQITLTV